jgi:hypothetical protein
VAKEEYFGKIMEENNKFQDLWRGNVHGIVEEERREQRRKKNEPK